MSTKFVLDASVTLSWAFSDEFDAVSLAAQRLLESPESEAIAPGVWWYEVRNVLLMAERRGRISAPSTAAFLKELADMPIATVGPPDERLLLDLSRNARITAYDAAYLALAIENDCPLATLDRALVIAAKANNVGLLAG